MEHFWHIITKAWKWLLSHILFSFSSLSGTWSYFQIRLVRSMMKSTIFIICLAGYIVTFCCLVVVFWQFWVCDRRSFWLNVLSILFLWLLPFLLVHRVLPPVTVHLRGSLRFIYRLSQNNTRFEFVATCAIKCWQP